MTIKGLSLFIGTSFISALSLAQPTFLTELNAGDTWVKTQYTKLSSESNYDNAFTADEDSDVNLFNFELITASEFDYAITPVIGISVKRLSENKETVTIKNTAVGGLFNLDDERQGLLSINYAKSNKKLYIRDSLTALLAFEMSEKDNPIKNELSISGSYDKKYSGISGGHEFTLLNKSKLPFSQKLELVLNIGTELTTDTKFSGGSKISYDPAFTYGGELNIHPSKNFSLQLSMTNTSRKTKEFSETVKETYKMTAFSLIGRF